MLNIAVNGSSGTRWKSVPLPCNFTKITIISIHRIYLTFKVYHIIHEKLILLTLTSIEINVTKIKISIANI